MNAPWLKLHIAWMDDPDFDALPLEAQAIFFKMLGVQWRDGSLPGDPEELARKCKVRVSAMQMHVQKLLQLLVQRRDGTYIFEPLERDRQRSGLVSQARSEAAKRRWNKDVDAIASANGNAFEDANAHPFAHANACRSKKKEERSEREDLKPLVRKRTAPATLESIYQTYPRKVGKLAALKAIEKAVSRISAERRIGEGEAAAFLIERTRVFANSPKGQLGDLTPHPATWYNRGSYIDDEREWQANTPSAPPNTGRKFADLEELYGQ
jgi:hypothetical protein